MNRFLMSLFTAVATLAAIASWKSWTIGFGSAFSPLAAISLVVVVVAGLAAWLRVPVLAAFSLQVVAAAGIALGVIAHQPGTLRDTFATAGSTVDASLPPVAVHGGILPFLVLGGSLAIVAGQGVTVWLRRPALGGFIPIVVFATTYALNAAQRDSVRDTGVPWWSFVIAALAFLGSLILSQVARPPVATLAVAGLSSFLAIGVAAIVPVANIDVGGWGRGNHTVVVTNPLVSLHNDLTQNDDVILLTVSTTGAEPTYLRLATLTTFDGSSWSVGTRRIPSTQRADGTALSQFGVDPTVPHTQSVETIAASGSFDSKWLPTPFPVATVTAPGDWRYDVGTHDFLSASSSTNTRGLTYSTVAEDFTYSRDDLLNATTGPGFADPIYLTLPSNIDPMVQQLAQQVVSQAHATSPFAEAIALQNFFRTTGGFTYSTDVNFGSSADDLVRFLTPGKGGRTGFCQQFSAAMAAMARTLGIPARVDVGFLDPTQIGPHTYQFSSHDMHAWPELYFNGLGWVRFEPTPAARATSTPSYTDVDLSNPVDPITPTQPLTSSAPTRPTQTARPGQDHETPGSTTTAESGRNLPVTLVIALVVLVVLGLLAALPRVIRDRRRKRRLAGGPEEIWEELRDTAEDLGLSWPRSRSPRETSSKVLGYVRASRHEREAFDRVVEAVERERYGAIDVVDDLSEDTRTLINALSEQVSPSSARFARWLPRSLWRR